MSALEITHSDIVFECPACSKSMVIDQRGAGRVIACPGCGRRLTVPQSPATAASAGATPTPAATPSVAPVSSLPEAQARIELLTAKLQEVSARRKYLEHVRTKNLDRLEKVRQEFSVIQGSLDRVYEVMQELDADNIED